MICIENISKKYKKTLALNNISYKFDKGIYAILGPNGSGKSTLMNIMTNNLKFDSGNIYFEERGEFIRYEKIRFGYVPQYPAMYPNFTAYEMLDYTAIINKVSKREEQIKELLEIFELIEHSNKKIKALSGGMKQRLAIAQGFIGKPQLVILDEPTAGLDPLQRIMFKNYISSLQKEMTIIISTHIVSDVEDISDNIIFLKKGVIAKEGKLINILNDIKNKCWIAPRINNIPENISYRLSGEEIRIVSDTKPCREATMCQPTLEDYYMHIFGELDENGCV